MARDVRSRFFHHRPRTTVAACNRIERKKRLLQWVQCKRRDKSRTKESNMKQLTLHHTAAWLLAASLLFSGCAGRTPQADPDTGDTPHKQETVDSTESTAAAAHPDSDFTAYTEDYVRQTCENSYLVLHHYFEDPESFGIDPAKAEVTLGSILPDEEDMELEDEMAERLQSFDRADLDLTQQVIYDSLSFQFDVADQVYDTRYNCLDQIWNAYNNPADSLVQTFSEYELRKEADIAPLITLLEDTPRFVDDCMAYTKEQADRGLLMLEYDDVQEKCEEIIEAGSESAVSRNLQEEIRALDLPEKTEETYLDQVNKALETSFYPQFDRICRDLKPWQDKSRDITGLANLENGRDYYTALAHDATGTEDTPEEMQENLQKTVVSLSLQMQNMMDKDPQSVQEATNLVTDFKSVDEIMAFLEDNYQRDFPTVQAMDYEVQPLSGEQANPGVMAYFMIPPVDNTAPCRIRFNAVDYGSDTTDVALYDTLAHEGIPGHMYQTQYDHETFVYPIQYMLNNSGFTEGYATYVEGQANKWLDASQNAVKFYNWMMMLTNCYTALMDLSVNYEGASLEEFNEEYGDVFGSGDLSDIYDQLAFCPAQFQSYYYGHYTIMTLRNEARKALGSSFESRDFNQALLKDGSVPFAIVERNIQTYIDSRR